jgi:hypothetical protein
MPKGAQGRKRMADVIGNAFRSIGLAAPGAPFSGCGDAAPGPCALQAQLHGLQNGPRRWPIHKLPIEIDWLLHLVVMLNVFKASQVGVGHRLPAALSGYWSDQPGMTASDAKRTSG